MTDFSELWRNASPRAAPIAILSRKSHEIGSAPSAAQILVKPGLVGEHSLNSVTFNHSDPLEHQFSPTGYQSGHPMYQNSSFLFYTLVSPSSLPGSAELGPYSPTRGPLTQSQLALICRPGLG